MLTAFKVFSALVALLHFGFLVLEMFLWATPFGMKVFRLSENEAQITKILAQNQGLYNGFLATGIVYGLVTGDLRVIVLFLIFVAIAGVYGGVTASSRIIYIQALPALMTLTIGLFL